MKSRTKTQSSSHLANTILHFAEWRSCFPRELLGQPGTPPGYRVGGGGRNDQFHFGAGANFAPNHQLASHGIGAFPHALQAKVPHAPLPRQNCWINAFTIIPHTQPELLMVISNLSLDLPSL